MVGATNRDLAERFGVARSTIDHWIATIPEFGEAVRTGRECADISVVKSLFNRALGFRRTAEKVFHYRGEIRTATYNVHVDADVRACIFWLRNRQRRYWLERAEPDDEEDDEAWQAELDQAAERVRRAKAR